ncbi:unnamed protein product [Ectocarpus fasciculatus]
MRTTNRGDVPGRHVAPSQAKGVAEDVDDVVFDAGSLSFVQDWVVDGGDTSAAAAAAATVEAEPRREDPRKTNPNRRLGVGAQPKKPKQDRPEPSALEKKMLRKRQRQELSDAIAGEMDTHGVVDDDKEGDGESKTASFKKKKKKSTGQQGEQNFTAPAPADPAAPAAGGTKSRKTKGAEEAVGGSGDGNSGGSGAGDAGGDGEKSGGKRKARRKKKKSAAPEVATGEADAAGGGGPAAVAAETPDKNSAAVVEETSPMIAAEAEVGGGGKVAETAEPGESKKQRRGWGKARSKSAGAAADTAENANQTNQAEERSGRTDEHRPPRKKTRSRQKNIRKDKRPADQRPAYLRAGDPEFSGRGLTEETRKFLGLPQDDFGDAPPAGWGKPGKVVPTASWVIDKKPRRLPKHLEPDAGGEGRNAAMTMTSAAASTDAGRKSNSAPAAAEAAPSVSGKSKYKNLSLTPGGKTSAKKKRAINKGSHGHGPGGAGGVKSKA